MREGMLYVPGIYAVWNAHDGVNWAQNECERVREMDEHIYM